MEMLTSQGLLTSANVALPVGVTAQTHEECSPQEDVLSSPSLSSPQTSEHSPTTTMSTASSHSQTGTETRRKADTKWSKGINKYFFNLCIV